MNFSFENPHFFWLLPLAICLIFCKKEAIKMFLPKLEWIPKRSRFFNTQTILKVLIFILTIFALSSPITFNNIQPSSKYGVDIVLALDSSGSMRESGFSKIDDEKSKFELLQELSSNFIDKRPSDNIGIVAFGSFAYSPSPVTYDHQSLKELLSMLEVEIAGKNTAIGEAIAQSITTLEFSQSKNKIIILITDGITNSGKISVKEAVKNAQEKNIKIYTIGLGEEKEFDSKLLKLIAKQTGAKSFKASTVDELELVYQEINSLHPTKIRSEQYISKQPLFQYLLILVIILFLILIKSNKSKLLYLSLIFVIIAITKPTKESKSSEIMIKGSDIIIALDVSTSMSATDIKPSRLIKSKQIIEKLIEQNPHDRFSLFAFTTNALILSPPTTDGELLILALHSLKTENILTHGTSIKNLLNRVSKLNIKEKNLIILSDGGEDLDLKLLHEISLKNSINIFSIGMATRSGTTIKDRYNNILKDSNQNIIITKLNPQLKELSDKFMTIKDIDYKIDFIKKQDFSTTKKADLKELFTIPLSFSLLLFFIYFVKIPKKLLFLLPFLASTSHSSILDWYYIQEGKKAYHAKNYEKAIKYFEQIDSKTMQTRLNIANSYYQDRQYKKAILIYQELQSTNPKTKKLIYFKLGNAYTMLKDYEKAKYNYTNALKIKKDKATIHNLKLIAFKISGKKHINKNQSSKTKNSDSNKQTKANKNIKNSKSNKKTKLTRPLGYKAYSLINKGYIDEKTPW